MYLRFIHFDIEDSRLQEVRDFYQQRILAALREIEGCGSASLLQSTVRSSRCISLTIWHDDHAATDWTHGDLYRQILEDAAPLLTGANRWRGALSKSVIPESAVRAFTVEAGTDLETVEESSGAFFLRLTSFRVAPGQWDRLVDLYGREVTPTLLSVDGCTAAFLVESLEDPDRGLSVSIWDREEDAVRYEISGRFDALTRRLRDTLIPTHQWQGTLTAEGSADGNPPAEGFRVVVGERFSTH